MACAKLSERFFLSGRSTVAKSPTNSRVTQVAHTKSLPSNVLVSPLRRLLDGCSCDLVVVGDRPRPSNTVAGRASLKYVINPARYPGRGRFLSQLFHLKNNKSLHALDQVPDCGSCNKVVEWTSLSPGTEDISLHLIGSCSPVFPAAVVTTSVCRKTNSKCSDSLHSRHSQLLQAAPASSHSHPPQDEDNQSPSPAQLSFVLLKLRDELPTFFNGHHSYNMYSSDLVFKNKLLPFASTLHSRWSYKFFLGSASALLKLGFANLGLDLLRITKDVDKGKVEARWRIRGRARFRPRERVILDGFSEFQVNSEGLIFLHKMDRIISAQERSPLRSVLGRPLDSLLPKEEPSLSQGNSSS